jgi:hypothetical protein
VFGPLWVLGNEILERRGQGCDGRRVLEKHDLQVSSAVGQSLISE